MRVRRKDTIFRVYLVSFAVLCVLGVLFALSGQARYHRAQVARLESRLNDLSVQLNELRNAPSAVASSDESRLASRRLTLNQQKALDQADQLFYVEGHGYNKRYAYLDLRFYDGYRARYYFRPYPSREELVALHKRIEHDALDHYYLPELDDFGDDEYSLSWSWHDPCFS